MTAIYVITDMISHSPKLGMAVKGKPDVRSLPLSRFPYRLYYHINETDEVITLLLIFNMYQDPNNLEKFLEQP